MSEDGRQPSVAKHWEQVATNLGILSESVLWRDLVPLLAELPETARKSEDSNNSLIATVDQEASASTGRATGKSFKLAQAPYRPSGLVLDYVAVLEAETTLSLAERRIICPTAARLPRSPFRPGRS